MGGVEQSYSEQPLPEQVMPLFSGQKIDENGKREIHEACGPQVIVSLRKLWNKSIHFLYSFVL